MDWLTTDCCGIAVSYRERLDGGGIYMSKQLVEFLERRKAPQQGRVFEWCAGPAFIGLSLLGRGLCRSLALADVNPAALEAQHRTIRANRLESRVSTYLSDNLASISEGERWNMVVGNPPHFADAYPGDILRRDENWNLHRGFFRDVQRFLTENGVILLLENNEGSTAETFAPMAEGAGLKVIMSENDQGRTTRMNIYVLAIMRKDAVPPLWLR